MSKVIGIDLGTTNSVVAVMEGGQPTIIPSLTNGGRTLPSVVAFSNNGERIVGINAKKQAVANPNRTIASIKRHMGTDYQVDIDGKKYSPQEISAMILQQLKSDAEAYLGEKVNQAVITVPAYFNDSQRQATKDAGKIAGLEVLRILNEPTAAALAYGIDKADDAHTILVYDLGGGTFDVSILELGDGVFEVKSTNGNTRLGGDDFDQRLVDYIAEEFKKESGVDLRADKMTLQRVKDAAETAKIELSSATQTQVYIPFVTATSSVNLSITRAKFNELTKDLVQATIEPMKKALSDADLNFSQIDKVILVGGSTRIPAVVEAVKNFTGKEPSKGVNPDEVVGLGAAIQAGVLTGDVKDIVLLDVTPLSLGIETLGGIADVIIPRNTTIPTRTTKTYSTAQDNQPGVEIVVVQGERKMAMDNKVLGRFQLTGIMPARRGVPQIEITFDIDANGIVKVSAIDKHTNKEANITITASTNLSNDEIDKAVKEAEKFAEEDKKRQEEIEIKNNAEAAVYQTENSMNELGDKLSSEDRATLTEKLDALKAVKDGSDLEAMKKAQEDLMNAFYSISQKAYAATEGAAPSEGPAQNNGASEEDNVVDANFVEEDK